MTWQDDALCREVDPDLFFLEPTETAQGRSGYRYDVREAKKVCSACPVINECLEWAMSNDERFGVFGGMSAQERIELRRQRTGIRYICNRCGGERHPRRRWCGDCGAQRERERKAELSRRIRGGRYAG